MFAFVTFSRVVFLNILYTRGDSAGASGSGILSLQLLCAGLADTLYGVQILRRDESSKKELLCFGVNLAQSSAPSGFGHLCHVPSGVMLIKLANTGYDVTWLLCGEESGLANWEDERKLLEFHITRLEKLLFKQ